MALALGSSGTAATGTTSLSVGYPASIASGDLLVLLIANKYPTNGPSTPSGWTLIDQGSGGHGASGADSGNTYATAYYKQATGSESGSLSVTITGGNTSIGRMHRFTRTSSVPWSGAGTNGSDNNGGAAAVSVTFAGNPGIQAGDLVLVNYAANTDARQLGTHAVSATGVSAWGAATTLFSAMGTGDFAALDCSLHAVTTGTASAAPVYSATKVTGSTTDAPAGGVVLIRIRSDPPPPISFGTAGAVAVGTTSLSIPYPASIAAGDMLVVAIANKYPANGPTTPSGDGFAFPTNGQGSGGIGAAGADSGTVYSTVYWKQATGSESGNLSVTLTSANGSMGRMFRYTKASGYTWVTPAAHNGADNTAGTAFSVTAGADPGLTADDMLVMVAATNTDARTYASQAVTATGITGWGTVTERQDSGTTSGDDCALVVSEHPVSVGTSSAAPVFVMTASGTTANQNAGSAVFLRLRAAAASGSYTLTCTAGSFGYSGKTANLNAARLLTSTAGSFPFSGKSVGLNLGRRLSVTSGSFPFTAVNAALTAQRLLTSTAGSFPFSGKNAGLNHGWILSATAGSFPFTASNAVLKAARLLTSGAGSFPFTGSSAGLNAGRLLSVTAGSFPFTGNDVTLTYTPSGGGASYTLTVTPGAFPFTSNDAALSAGRLIAATSGSFPFTASNADLNLGRRLTSVAGAFPFTAGDAELRADRFLTVTSAAFPFTGNQVVLRPFVSGGGATFFIVIE